MQGSRKKLKSKPIYKTIRLGIFLTALTVLIAVMLKDFIPTKEQFLDSEYESSKSVIETLNYSTNIVNGGIACYDGSRYFFSNECLWCEDNSGKDISKIYDKSVFYLNLVDEYLYFVVPSENNSICRIKKDGTEFEKIYDSFCYELTYYDGWLYFSSNWGGEEFHVCRMRTDGSDYKMLRRGECYDLCVVNNRIIFSTDMELRRLHSIDFNGDNEVILLNSYARFTNYYDEKLFFVNSEGMLCSCNLDGSNLTVLYNSTSYSFLTLLPQKIFCCDANKNNQLVVLGMQI